MSKKTEIIDARARQIWDSRGRPTIEVELSTRNCVGRGIAPAGASRGAGEAIELRDGSASSGVSQALKGFDAEIKASLIGLDCRNQSDLDSLMCELDGCPDKSRLGANTLIATSIAVAQLAAECEGLPLWYQLAGSNTLTMPLPEVQIIGGGVHAAHRIEIQDLMVLPIGAETWTEALDMSAAVYRSTGQLLADRQLLQGVADEGGFWPNLPDNEAALELLTESIERAGFKPLDNMAISIDVAGSQFFKGGCYVLNNETERCVSQAWVQRLAEWCNKFPVVMVEDPCAEQDLLGFKEFFQTYTQGLVVGDDLIVTNAMRIQKAHEEQTISAVLVKPDQAGTLTEAHQALTEAGRLGMPVIVSARSGETEDTSIVDLAVGWQAPMIKIGSITRGERTAKWNHGLRIAEQLTTAGQLPARAQFPW